MTPTTPHHQPAASPPRLHPAPPGETELCARLEAHGIPTWSQGEGLLEDLRPRAADADASGSTTRTLLCAASASELLRALPRAVVTAASGQRVTQATAAGPIDLLPMADVPIERSLPGFGLSALAFAFRLADASWCDPTGALGTYGRGELDAVADSTNIFQQAPRRYWIAARLLSEHALRPTPDLIDAAREALATQLEALPRGAPARREMTRVLASAEPRRGLAFLRESGLSTTLFPGIETAREELIDALPAMPALRWAAWLRGSATASALVCLRVPHALARRVERLQSAHPIDETVASLREVGIRRILQRLDEDEIAGLFCWRRLELAADPDSAETRALLTRLDQVEERIARGREQQQRSGRVRTLALDGRAVMTALGAGPGPHVGRALAHLANFVEADPEANARDPLLAELRSWSAANPDAIVPRRS